MLRAAMESERRRNDISDIYLISCVKNSEFIQLSNHRLAVDVPQAPSPVSAGGDLPSGAQRPVAILRGALQSDGNLLKNNARQDSMDPDIVSDNGIYQTQSMNDIESLSPALQALEVWSHAAKGAYSPNTERSWRADWQSFTAWCRSEGVQPLPAPADTVARYLREESAVGRAVATIRHRASTIAKAHQVTGLADPCAQEPVRLALRAIARERGTQQKQAPALNGTHAAILAHVADAQPRLKELRDVALMLVGRDLMARASELVSIPCEALSFDEEDGTAQILLRRFKTSTEALPCQIGPDAAEALQRWLTASGISSGPLFVSVTKGGRPTGRPLSDRDVSRVLKGLAKRARLKSDFSAHSLRVGMAQDLTAANVEGAAIMQAAGWTTPRMLARYTAKLSAKRGAIARYYSRRK
jgi:site-specific recombinase XerD